jgi:hypothetical protein
MATCLCWEICAVLGLLFLGGSGADVSKVLVAAKDSFRLSLSAVPPETLACEVNSFRALVAGSSVSEARGARISCHHLYIGLGASFQVLLNSSLKPPSSAPIWNRHWSTSPDKCSENLSVRREARLVQHVAAPCSNSIAGRRSCCRCFVDRDGTRRPLDCGGGNNSFRSRGKSISLSQ